MTASLDDLTYTIAILVSRYQRTPTPTLLTSIKRAFDQVVERIG